MDEYETGVGFFDGKPAKALGDAKAVLKQIRTTRDPCFDVGCLIKLREKVKSGELACMPWRRSRHGSYKSSPVSSRRPTKLWFRWVERTDTIKKSESWAPKLSKQIPEPADTWPSLGVQSRCVQSAAGREMLASSRPWGMKKCCSWPARCNIPSMCLQVSQVLD